jgi:VIT1/CCC1 family predicted Fe2+/Mn2+ transporter
VSICYTVCMKIRKVYIAEFVYGAIDGTITTFAVMAGALGAALSPAIVLILGFANLFADGFSMAVSNYLSRKSESHVVPDDEDEKDPFYTALATFVSFVAVGIIPLLPFVFAFKNTWAQEHAFVLSIGCTALAFAVIGFMRGWVTNQNRFVAILETLLIGGIAAVIAFSVGYFLRGVVGV